MAQAKKIEPIAKAARPEPAAPPSPARELHRLLQERTVERAAPEVERWSQRRALGFIVTSSAALWLAILTAARAVVHAIA